MTSLSYAQRRLWFMDQLDKATTAYNSPMALRLSGKLDVVALENALGDVLTRHEPLRTIYPAPDGDPTAKTLDPARVSLSLDVRDAAPGNLNRLLSEFTSYRFDITCEIPVRAVVFRLSELEHVLLLLVHHIAADGWSMAPLARDLSAAYTARLRGEAADWPELPVEYSDYTEWQEELLSDAAGEEESLLKTQLDYWRTRLAGAPEELNIPTDRPRPAIPSYRGAEVRFSLDAEVQKGVSRLSSESSCTPFMIFHAALTAMLSRISGSTDIPIGIPVAGRTDEGLENLVGFFVNNLVLRLDMPTGVTYRALLEQSRQCTLEALEHQDVPFEFLVDSLNPTRSLSRNPLFQVVLAFQNNDEAVWGLPGLSVESVHVENDTAKFDLTFSFTQELSVTGEELGISGVLEYATDLFDHASAEEFVARFNKSLRVMLARPDEPVHREDVLQDDERQRILRRWNDTVRGHDQVFMGSLVERHAEARPDAVAVDSLEGIVTYRQLNERANRLAHYLIDKGIGPERVVAVVIPRSLDMVVSVLAVLKSGGAYLPIDTEYYPADRISFILQDSAPSVILTLSDVTLPSLPDSIERVDLDALQDTDILEKFSARNPTDTDRVEPLTFQHTAYVIYTSGSTGTPKGVVVTHAGIGNLGTDNSARFGVSPESRLLQFASLSFDSSAAEFMIIFSAGGSLVMRESGRLAGEELGSVFRDARITHVLMPPPILHSVPVQSYPDLRAIMLAGDTCTNEVVRDWVGEQDVFNIFGPTETTVHATATAALDGIDMSIGAPLSNTRIYVLDADLNPVPPGVVGEAYIAGIGLAREYLNRPSLTAERFVADPFGGPGERMYRTGDLFRWRRDGRLEFIGRADHQVKLRGFRVELGEIEATLHGYRLVRNCAVTVREDATRGKYLAAYVATDEPTGLQDELREFLKTRLPDYMVPASISIMESLPLTQNGKVDRKALPEPAFSGGRGSDYATPREQALSGLIAEVLGVSEVGPEDKFFEIGGNSLLATRLVARIRSDLGFEVSLRTIFEEPRVGDLAQRLKTASSARPALRPRR
ncbi:amino acid adenylation domain-containing protein [Streptomyces sp. NPDC059755]|uniref:non-ribosomal peptide synthetase n=1 Tax=Streptomyces sp. NPDC059755 TaxID=3346934 RepID=UPI003646E364